MKTEAGGEKEAKGHMREREVVLYLEHKERQLLID